MIALTVHEVILNPDEKIWLDSFLESLGHQRQILKLCKASDTAQNLSQSIQPDIIKETCSCPAV